jgi:radical SAM family uncharacterized protein/radical SAM-linked protein
MRHALSALRFSVIERAPLLGYLQKIPTKRFHGEQPMMDNLLCTVQRPGRYLGNEVNLPRKDWRGSRVRIVLAFPDVYEIGMSHLGLLLLYQILNNKPGIGAERVFAPWPDMETRLRSKRKMLTSLESGTPLSEFDVVGFSLQYELSYTNVLTMLELGGIPVSVDARDSRMPIIIGGGPCTFNPEPLASFFDAFVLGDAEELILEIVDTVDEWKSQGGERLDLLKVLAELDGVYVPEFFKPRYSEHGLIEEIVPLFPGKPQVRKRILTNLDLSRSPEQPLVPSMGIVHDRLNLELTRGCTRGCRFCQAGFTYRPVRERSPQQALRLLRRDLETTGYDELSLLALSIGDYSHIKGLMQALMQDYGDEQVAISLPSLRVGTLDEDMVKLISQVRKTGFTLAPEAGSERLRRVINKDILTSELLDTVHTVYSAGWPLLKLYFMMGLPTERAEDRDALVELVYRVWREAARHKPKRRVHISVSTFVPKAHTPFQWEAQLSLEEIEKNVTFFKQWLRKRGLQLKWHQPWQSILEGVFSRGDRQLAPVLVRAQQLGCRFDGWSEHLRVDLWRQSFREAGIDPSFYGQRVRGPDELFPWSHLDCGVSRDYLWEEYEKALAEVPTPDCREDGCIDCGVCDHKRVTMQIQQKETAISAEKLAPKAIDSGTTYRYRVVFAKMERARFYSHLDMASIFQRAMRRAKLPVAYSRGYRAKPRIKFSEALPLGLESRAEEMEVVLTQPIPTPEIYSRLNGALPSGLEVVEVEEKLGTDRVISGRVVTYEAILPDGSWPLKGVHRFERQLLEPLRQKTKKGERVVPLEGRLLRLDVMDGERIRLALIQGENGKIRIRDLLAHIFDLTEEQVLRARVVKTGSEPMKG